MTSYNVIQNKNRQLETHIHTNKSQFAKQKFFNTFAIELWRLLKAEVPTQLNISRICFNGYNANDYIFWILVLEKIGTKSEVFIKLHKLVYFVIGHTKPKAPDPIRTPKLSGLRRG